ncbi:MAG: N-6 DNA methylase [Comamonadaceae bacterium]|nr:N-6 DNA methylase [Comamonadaceae bacterium]
MVDCIAPKPGETICDPACGTGGFLLRRARLPHAAQPQPRPATRSATSRKAPSAAGSWCRPPRACAR